MPRNITDIVRAGLKKRYRAEARFRLYGITAILAALVLLFTLFVTIVSQGASAFVATELTLSVPVTAAVVDPEGTRAEATLSGANYRKLVLDALDAQFPDVQDRIERRKLHAIVSDGATYDLREKVMANPALIGTTVTLTTPVASDFDMLAKGQVDVSQPESLRRLNDRQIGWFNTLKERGLVSFGLDRNLFVNADSRQPELAGIFGALMGSLYTLLVTLALSFPMGVAAAVYLEEYAPRNRLTDIIEVNINNLAAVPSIVFGLLGLAIFLGFFGLPRSAPLVGGLVLSLMTLPTIIIAARVALQSVPPSIREAALGIGASKMQTVLHHVLPLALPGIMTGTIIGMARALGETAPLLMIGMVAFIADTPEGILSPSTVLPVQIYIWADSPERAFLERMSAAIIILLTFLVIMNTAAVWLRRKFERKW
ncbi:phosphate ABC transporter permease PstA [Phaeovibrio sulfidiphilus]|uniref:Phosphate transport system permease protein PstA n=1 Tax=Phaeovibrio sulfidiphilus TaxID=1220600 RepID=A0A8J6YY48_9PROT|nr:phosphate ABC transporter permease PstA [Phaeovibrio sulfidiphilus]MBE1236668.1 phosphate ABC transporter permease PstA [Phaeovibrio sulfidiphilus]